MTETEAIVVALNGGEALVQTRSQSGCGRCHEPGGCGGQSLSQMFCATPREYALPNVLGLVVGDTVVLGIPDDVLHRTALLAYVLPVLAVIGGAVLGRLAGGDNQAAVLGAASGLAGGWLLLRWRRRSADGQLQILRKKI